MSCLDSFARAHVVMARNDPVRLVAFIIIISSMISWKQMVVYQAKDIVFMCPFMPERHRTASCANNFCWVWLLWTTRSVDCCLFFQIMYKDVKLLTSLGVKHDIRPRFNLIQFNTKITFFEHFFTLIDTSNFSSGSEIMQNLTSAVFLTGKRWCKFS